MAKKKTTLQLIELITKQQADKKAASRKIGSFAGITFTVSRTKVLTFSDLKRNDSYRWTNHDILNGKPLSEFHGADGSGLTLRIELKKSFGVSSPYATLKKLRVFAAAGKTSAFLLGKKTVSNAKFRIVSIGQEMENITAKGEVLSISVDLTLEEYRKTTAKKSKTTKAKSKTTAKKKTSTKSKQKATGTITIKASNLNVRMSASLKGKVKKVAVKNQKFKVYGTKKTDITWYKLAGGLYCSANSKYVSFKKA